MVTIHKKYSLNDVRSALFLQYYAGFQYVNATLFFNFAKSLWSNAQLHLSFAQLL